MAVRAMTGGLGASPYTGTNAFTNYDYIPTGPGNSIGSGIPRGESIGPQKINRITPTQYSGGGSNLFRAMSAGPIRSFGINAQPIYTPQMTKEAMNRGLAQNAGEYQQAMNDINNGTATGGLLQTSMNRQALANQARTGFSATNQDAIFNVPWNVAKANAEHQQQGAMFNATARNNAEIAANNNRNALMLAMARYSNA